MAKKDKGMTKQELKAPDQVEVALRSTWERIMDHRKVLLGLLGAVIVVGVALAIWQSSRRSAVQDRAEAFRQASSPLLAPVGEADPAVPVPTDRPAPERFETREAALAAAEERLGKFLESHGGSEAASPARFAHASALLGQKKTAEAIKALEAWVADNEKSALRPAALEKLAQAYLVAGDRAKAIDTYKKLADTSKGLMKALALVSLGDLHHPMVVAGGDVAQARKFYDEAKTVLGPRPVTDPNDVLGAFGEPAIYSELERKLSTLP